MVDLPKPWFGLRPPETAVMAWGARAIVEHGRFSLLWDRMQCAPECGRDDTPEEEKARHRKLHDALENTFLPKIRNRLACRDIDLVGSSSAVTELEHDGVRFKCSPRASHGYLYMVAWIEEDEGVSDA